MQAAPSRLLLIFLSLSMLGSIKVYLGGNLGWLLLGVFLAGAAAFDAARGGGGALLHRMQRHDRPYLILLVGWLMFAGGFVIAGALTPGAEMLPLLKYGAIWIVLIILISLGIRAVDLQKALVIALLAAILPFLILVLARVTSGLVVLGDGRMGWAAAWPGVLWKVGAYAWPIALWRWLKNGGKAAFLLVTASLLTMAVDGSRTSMVWLLLVWGALLFIGYRFGTPNVGIGKQVPLVLTAAVVYLVVQPFILAWVEGNALSVSSDVAWPWDTFGSALPNNSTALRIVKGDTHTRLEMLEEGLARAVENFPFGCGFGCAMVGEGAGAMVVHMTYLQVLAEGGILSLVGYLVFLLYPLYLCLKYVGVRGEAVVQRLDLMLAPLSTLILFLFIGLFHPVSNELTEWAIVVAAIAVIISHVPRRN